MQPGEVHEIILGQPHTGTQGRAKQIMQPQNEEQYEKSAFALTARGSISKAMKGLVGGAATR